MLHQVPLCLQPLGYLFKAACLLTVFKYQGVKKLLKVLIRSWQTCKFFFFFFLAQKSEGWVEGWKAHTPKLMRLKMFVAQIKTCILLLKNTVHHPFWLTLFSLGMGDTYLGFRKKN